MKSANLIVWFFMLTITLYAQPQYRGCIVDLGNLESVTDVNLLNTQYGINTTTNFNGEYQLFCLDSNTNQAHLPLLWIGNQTLYWSCQLLFKISLYTSHGTLIDKFNADSPSGSYSLNYINPGWYILHIESEQQQNIARLYYDGRTYNVENKTKSINANDLNITLSKLNYYTRTITVNENDENALQYLLAEHYDSLHFFPELIQREAFDMTHADPHTTNFGEVQSIKGIYDFINDQIYYINTKEYHSHYNFAKDQLGTPFDNMRFFMINYGQHKERHYHTFTINYHKNIAKYVLEFSPFDLATCDYISETYDKIIETSYLSDSLYFFANKLNWENCNNIPTISAHELFMGQNYQALNTEEGYGYLRKVDINNLANEYIHPHDIVVLNGIPNDLSVVAGIITTEYQTPLSHINILSHNRRTPNMALIDGWTNPQINDLIGKLVHLEVKSNVFTLTEANIDSALIFWQNRENRPVSILEMDTITKGLIDLNDANYQSVKTIGGKAANFAEMVNLGSIPLPESHFAIPFYYYQQHINHNGIDGFIRNMLSDTQMVTDLAYRKEKLKELRKRIKEAPLNTDLEDLVRNKIDHFQAFESFRFRSSTNAEDLDFFSGAGLYDSKSAKINDEDKSIENAIKKVWASLWNERAFNEREYYKIDQKSIAMGVLVHRSFPDEDANGVVITKNMYNINHAFTINAQHKEFEIAQPDEGITHDLVLAFTISLDGNSYSYEYLSRSNIAELNGNPVLTDAELKTLCDYCKILKNHYYNNIPNNSDAKYREFALDIEFKIDSEIEERKLYIKQVRQYPE